ncbi:hypothetical protein J2X98_002065 [Pseudarthrobacter enclensis]|uniref:Uncharacterized protein n=1 Tax=Pseudarthrobacter enclensis TaxID=993070 RepID=A0ABT9RTT2_9MICC|nr:hypothetical protein [Pseudarthrobacter enclensis]
MQVAPRGPPGGAHAGDGLPCLHPVAGVDTNGLKVVVRGDEAVAVVDFYAVPSTPGMPSCRADNAGIRCIDRRSASSGEVLAQMEVPRCPADRADPEPKG